MLGPIQHMKKKSRVPPPPPGVCRQFKLHISGLLSQWAFVPVGFCPSGLLSSGLLS